MYSRWSSGAVAPGEITGEMCNEARKNQTRSDKVDQSWSDEYRYNDIVIWNFRDARLHYVITDVIRIGLTIDYPFPHVREYCVKISAFSDKYKQPCCRKENNTLHRAVCLPQHGFLVIQLYKLSRWLWNETATVSRPCSQLYHEPCPERREWANGRFSLHTE